MLRMKLSSRLLEKSSKLAGANVLKDTIKLDPSLVKHVKFGFTKHQSNIRGGDNRFTAEQLNFAINSKFDSPLVSTGMDAKKLNKHNENKLEKGEFNYTKDADAPDFVSLQEALGVNRENIMPQEDTTPHAFSIVKKTKFTTKKQEKSTNNNVKLNRFFDEVNHLEKLLKDDPSLPWDYWVNSPDTDQDLVGIFKDFSHHEFIQEYEMSVQNLDSVRAKAFEMIFYEKINSILSEIKSKPVEKLKFLLKRDLKVTMIFLLNHLPFEKTMDSELQQNLRYTLLQAMNPELKETSLFEILSPETLKLAWVRSFLEEHHNPTGIVYYYNMTENLKNVTTLVDNCHRNFDSLDPIIDSKILLRPEISNDDQIALAAQIFKVSPNMIKLLINNMEIQNPLRWLMVPLTDETFDNNKMVETERSVKHKNLNSIQKKFENWPKISKNRSEYKIGYDHELYNLEKNDDNLSTGKKTVVSNKTILETLMHLHNTGNTKLHRLQAQHEVLMDLYFRFSSNASQYFLCDLIEKSMDLRRKFIFVIISMYPEFFANYPLNYEVNNYFKDLSDTMKYQWAQKSNQKFDVFVNMFAHLDYRILTVKISLSRHLFLNFLLKLFIFRWSTINHGITTLKPLTVHFGSTFSKTILVKCSV